jgi:hypothetical protein
MESVGIQNQAEKELPLALRRGRGGWGVRVTPYAPTGSGWGMTPSCTSRPNWS